MFVPHDPYNCFDVYRPNDRCVCGCSAVVTSHQGDDRGYCTRCSTKREQFVNGIIGDIFIGEESNINYAALGVMEEMRKLFFRERLNFMVDCFFAEHQNDDSFIEPYEDDSFVVRVYYEKQVMTERLLTTLETMPKVSNSTTHLIPILQYGNNNSDTRKAVLKAYEYYKEQLLEMRELDWDEIGVFNSKIGGYEYTRKFTRSSK